MTAPAAEDGSWHELSAVDRAMSRRMQVAAQIPLATLDVAVEVDAALAMVAEARSELPDATFTSVVLTAVGRALREHPTVASVVDHEARKRFVPRSPGVGVAVQTGRGLVVPVLRDVISATFAQITASLVTAVATVRGGRPDPSVFAGGHFTITNIAGGGIDGGTPMVNPPQSAILGLGTGKRTPIVRDDGIEVARVARFTLSLDHRALDGMTAAAFLTDVKARIEAPEGLLAGPAA